jgi:long-subunit acyl-CoA synthetase (AMP-forming)
MANGVNYGDKVLLLSETRVEWFLCAQAIAKLGGTIVTLFSNLGNYSSLQYMFYLIEKNQILFSKFENFLHIFSLSFDPRLGDDGIVYGMNQTEIKVMITSSDLMPKVKSLLNETPTVSTIVYINSYETPNTDDFPQNINLISLKEIEKTGSNSEFLFQTPKPDDPLIIMYTSGTTGIPKAAVATNRQFMASFDAFLTLVKDVIADYPNHTYIAYLPLAHVLELTIEIFLFHGIY